MKENQSFSQTEFLDLLPEIVFELDKDLNIKYINNACEEIFGYSISKIVNKRILLDKIVNPIDIERIKKDIHTNFKGLSCSGNNYRFLNKSNKDLCLEIFSSHIQKNGKVIGLRCIAIDITEKAAKQRDLKTQKNHFQQIFMNFPIPYQSLDRDGNILDVNPVWEKILGYKREEIIGKNFTFILTDENKTIFETDYQTFLETGEINNVQFDLITKSGSKIYVNYNGNIEFNENNEFYRSHCVFNDITLQRKAEQTLIQSEKRLRELNTTKDTFFSIIAHDLKNPFNDLMGFTQLLALNIEKYDKSKIEQFVNIIHQSSKLAFNLLENLLDWSSSQTGTLKFSPKKILINNFIKENIDLLESTARNKNVQIFSELETKLYVYADKNMVRTIIRNLISNAIKYTNQGGQITIKSCINNNVCEISVIDSGIGISEANISKILKIDESFSTIGTEMEKGTGLGLILCKEFIEKNGGKLLVKSELGKGSTFTFSLPLPETTNK